MKKYNRILALSVLAYLLIALCTGLAVRRMAVGKDQAYKIEINRIHDSLSKGTPLDELALHSYEYVRKVSYLPADALKEKETVSAFYQEDNRLSSKILPVFIKGQLDGFFRYDYQEPSFRTTPILVFTQVGLGLMELFLFTLLLYLKFQLIAPFQRMSNLPYELSQGHLDGVVRETRSRFFSHFLRGLGQLKDALILSRERQLELEREKKRMLLSLSHDIKTPLQTIKLYGKALEEGLYSQDGQKLYAARQIGQKSLEIERYVEEIMKNSREEILDIQVKDSEFYLADLMQKLVDTYGEKCRIRMVDLKVEEFENLLLKGDFDRSLEVLGNIFENAFKYGDGRRIEISFSEEDYRHLIRIFNTGEPVTDNEFNHIFESFYRASNSTGMRGQGLGLYICREIMGKMGGEIFAQKEEGGMAFVLVFR